MPFGSLEIGGSHLCVGLVRPDDWALQDFSRHRLNPQGTLDDFTGTLRSAVAGLAQQRCDQPTRWVVALPGPFDYSAGIAGVHPSGKLRALSGHNLTSVLAPVLGTDRIRFVNDAAAFALGAFLRVRPGTRRLVGLTLGSGIGSAFVEDGATVRDHRVPPGGEVYALPSAPGSDISVEDRFGPAAQARRGGFDSFRSLAAYARTSPGTVARIQADFLGLADALAPWLAPFAPEVIICGGSCCQAWDVWGEAFAARLREHVGVSVELSVDTEQTAMRGAVAEAVRWSSLQGDG